MTDKKLSSFFLTPGDLDGVGLEVSLKAIDKLLSQDYFRKEAFTLYVWHAPSQFDFIKSLFPDFKTITEESLNEHLGKECGLYFINSELSPANWFVQSIEVCKTKKAQGIITGPMTKQEIYSLGYNDIGHTDILRRLCQNQNFYMGFVGSKFNVTLYTDHTPINKIKLDKDSFQNFLNLSLQFDKSFSDPGEHVLPTILGFNPHAGDFGLIGSEDKTIKEWLKEWQLENEIKNPTSADTAFTHFQTFKKQTFLAFYHDQGLIPFKMAHGFSGFQTTLGLPFIRTSVDHGTAKNLFNKNTADFTSMFDAIVGAHKIWKGYN